MSMSNTITLEAASVTTDSGSVESSARIGPNAVLQLIETLKARGLGARLDDLFATANVAQWLAAPPGEMVDEASVARLHWTVRRGLSKADARAVMAEAGRRTADYLLANRIPRPAQALLRWLPARLAAEILVRAIQANAWTFAGSARFTAKAGSPTVFTLYGNPLCAGEIASDPVCLWHAAVFERLFQVLVSPRCRARETHCEAAADPFCRFEVRWR